MSIEERDILTSACAGDRNAFDRLVVTYRPELTALCYRFLNHRGDAEDVVQEVFTRAWQRLETYRGEASFRTWLWEIGRNLCLNRLRARKSQLNQRTLSMETMPATERQQPLDVPDPNPSPEELAVSAAHLIQIRQEIARQAVDRKWETTDWELFLFRIENSLTYAEFTQRRGRDEAYWRNRWRDKIKPVLDRVRAEILNSPV